MSTYQTIFKKKPLIIGLGIILGISSAEILSETNTAQIEQTVTSKQIKVGKTAKKKNSQTCQALAAGNRARSNFSGNSGRTAQAIRPVNTSKTC